MGFASIIKVDKTVQTDLTLLVGSVATGCVGPNKEIIRIMLGEQALRKVSGENLVRHDLT